MELIFSFVCFSVAGALLLWTVFRSRHLHPQEKHLLIVSHMRSLDSK